MLFFFLFSSLFCSFKRLLEQLKVPSKREQNIDFPHALPHTRTASPIISIPPDGTFVAIDESTLTHHNLPKSVVYIQAHSWACTCCGLRRTRKDMYPS